MTVSTQTATVISNRISGDYRIDVLLEEGSYRWNYPGALQSPAAVSYSFMRAAPAYAEAEDKKGFSPFTEAQKTATRQILNQVEQNFNITFKEVDDTATSYGQIRFGNNQQGETSSGYAFLPDAATGDQAGDLYINNDDPDNLANVVVGTYAYATLVHEIGHTLGLKHPGNYNAGESASYAPGNFLVNTEDTVANTVMSYVDVTQMQQREFFGLYDFLALQYLYGSRVVNAANNTYSYTNSAGRTLQIINDSGGIDAMDASGVTGPVIIDLREGAFSSIGRLEDGSAARDNLSISFGTLIENAIGSPLADTLTGNASANAITGGGGNDTLAGGAGLDTAIYAGALARYSIQQTASGYTITDGTGVEGTDSWTSIERAKFSDKKLAFDISGSAGNAAKIIAAALGPEFLKPTYDALKGTVISLLDGGSTLKALATSITGLDAFIQLEGSTANTDFVKFIYRNVVGGEASADQVKSLVGYMTDNKMSQGDFLATVAELHLNVDLVGLAKFGLEYV